MTKRTPRFAPNLIYLVEVAGMYTAPKRLGYIAGVQAWADPGLGMSLEDAKKWAAKVNGAVIKLRIRATAEPIKGPDAAWKAPVKQHL